MEGIPNFWTHKVVNSYMYVFNICSTKVRSVIVSNLVAYVCT